MGALDRDNNLTPLGHHLAALPVDVRIGKLMLFGAIFSCIDSALTMAACLSYKTPFVAPFGQREKANKARQKFAMDMSDQMTVLLAYNVSAPNLGSVLCCSLINFCFRNFKRQTRKATLRD